VSFNTPLGRADRFRPAPPDLPALGSSRRTSQVRDTLPPCLGSNCSLDKDRAGLSALVETRHYTHVRWAVNIPLSVFSLFLRSRWHEQRPEPQGPTALALHLPVLYTTCRGRSSAIRPRNPHKKRGAPRSRPLRQTSITRHSPTTPLVQVGRSGVPDRRGGRARAVPGRLREFRHFAAAIP